MSLTPEILTGRAYWVSAKTGNCAGRQSQKRSSAEGQRCVCEELLAKYNCIGSSVSTMFLMSRSDKSIVDVIFANVATRATARTSIPARENGLKCRRCALRSGSTSENGPEFAKRRIDSGAELPSGAWRHCKAKEASMRVQAIV